MVSKRVVRAAPGCPYVPWTSASTAGTTRRSHIHGRKARATAVGRRGHTLSLSSSCPISRATRKCCNAGFCRYASTGWAVSRNMSSIRANLAESPRRSSRVSVGALSSGTSAGAGYGGSAGAGLWSTSVGIGEGTGGGFGAAAGAGGPEAAGAGERAGVAGAAPGPGAGIASGSWSTGSTAPGSGMLGAGGDRRGRPRPRRVLLGGAAVGGVSRGGGAAGSAACCSARRAISLVTRGITTNRGFSTIAASTAAASPMVSVHSLSSASELILQAVAVVEVPVDDAVDTERVHGLPQHGGQRELLQRPCSVDPPHRRRGLEVRLGSGETREVLPGEVLGIG